MDAFLVRLSVSLWTARKLDKTATKEAKERANAGEKAGVKVYKTVLAAEALDDIQSIANQARVEHRKRTVPWAYDGPGAITAEGYPSYKAAMAALEKDFYRAVSAFYEVYAQERMDAKSYLGNMFDPNDYPTTESLRGRFAFSVHAEPMPKAEHFNAPGLAKEHVDDIRVDIAAQQADAMDDANATAWSRVIEKVEKLKLGLEGYKPAVNGNKVEGKFHHTLIDNIKELATLIPSINVAGDQELNRVQQKLVALTAYTAEDLKEDDNLRAQVAKQAGNLLAEISQAYQRAA